MNVLSGYSSCVTVCNDGKIFSISKNVFSLLGYSKNNSGMGNVTCVIGTIEVCLMEDVRKNFVVSNFSHMFVKLFRK